MFAEAMVLIAIAHRAHTTMATTVEAPARASPAPGRNAQRATLGKAISTPMRNVRQGGLGMKTDRATSTFVSASTRPHSCDGVWPGHRTDCSALATHTKNGSPASRAFKARR